MSEDNLEQKLADEREKVRLNSLKMLQFLGYKGNTKDLTQEQIDARVEFLLEQKKNAEIEATRKGNTSTKPAFFTGIDEEKENIEKVANAAPSELDMAEYMEGYDALTAHIQQLRPNSQVGHATQFGEWDTIRIMRLPASIRLNDNETVIRRVVL